MAGKGGLAKQVRAGLEDTAIEPKASRTPHLSLVPSTPGSNHDPLNDEWFGKTIRRHVLEFAQVFALIALGIAALWAYRGRSIELIATLVVVAGILLVLGVKAPRVLHPIWKIWMKFAMGLGHVMTLIILSIMWYIALMPLALGLKLFKKDVMDLSYGSGRESYWEPRKPGKDDFSLLERQF